MIGSGIAIRGGLVSIAVLAQVGGHLAPIVLSTGQPPGLALLAYVLMLQLVALILAQWGNSPKWWVLRGLSLAATAWWVAVCLFNGHWGTGLANEVLLFSILYAAAYQGDLLRSALRAGDVPAQRLPAGWGTAYSLLVTAGLTAVWLHVFYGYDSAAMRGVGTLVLAGLSLAGGYALLDRDGALVRALSVSYRVQGFALLVLFVPVTLSQVWIVPAWCVLAVAFAFLAARYGQDHTCEAAVATWLLALARLLIDTAQAQGGGPAGDVWLSLLGQPIKAYTVLAWLVAVLEHVTAWLVQADLGGRAKPPARRWLNYARFVSGVATVVWAVASIGALPPLGATLALLLGVWLLVAADYTPQRLDFAVQAWLLTFAAAVKWLLVDGLDARMAETWNPRQYLPVLNPFMGLGLALAVSLATIPALRRETLERFFGGRADSGGARFALGLVVVLTLALGLSFEVDRVVERGLALGHDWVWQPVQMKMFGLTLLWLVAALALAALARRLGHATLLPAVLLALVAGKFLLVDTLNMRLLASNGPPPVWVLVNFQVYTALALLAGLRFGQSLLLFRGGEDERNFRRIADLLALLVLLWAGTLEIDRAFAGALASWFHDPALATQVAVSIFWSLFALGTIAAGFRRRAAGLRYFGLTLFGVTLLKVLLNDLGQVKYGYRVLALLGLGLVLLATSVLYGKLGPALLREDPEKEDLLASGAASARR